MNILTVKDLNINFNTSGTHLEAVKGVNFELSIGETVGIVGESGSGKSVTSLALLRLLPAAPKCTLSGEILLKTQSGKSVNLLQIPERQMVAIRGKEIAMIFQEPMTSLNPVLTCGFQVAEAIRAHEKSNAEDAKKRAIYLFERVQLPDTERIWRSYPHQLSGGQQQRVMIAMALSCRPSILIADEPTTALDVTVQQNILKLLKELQQEFQMAMIFISHDLSVIREVADKILVMKKGVVVESGSAAAIFHSPQHPYTRGLLACRPSLAYKLRRLPTIEIFESSSTQSTDNQLFSKIIAEQKITAADIEQRISELSERKNLVEVKNLSVRFAAEKNWFGKTTRFTQAVDDVSFVVKKGETLGLVGESGCGKTTLSRALLRLIPSDEGQIFFEETDIFQLNQPQMRRQRREMQIIFQDPFSSLNPKIRIGDAITEPLEVHKIYDNQAQRKEAVMELLETVGLSTEHFYRYPHEFSGGQRQRVGIARALALRPKFLICDESVSALDVSVQAQVLNLLTELREKLGLTYIFISHDLAVVKQMSDRIMVMQHGKVVETATATELYDAPKTDYAKRLIAAIPSL